MEKVLSVSNSNNQKKLHNSIMYLVLAVLLIIWIIPFLWMFVCSFKPQKEILSIHPSFLPKAATLQNYIRWFTELDIYSYFGNSFIVAIITAFGNLVCSSMVGYALAKIRYPGKRLVFGAVMVTLMVPSVVTFVPLFVMVTKMGLLNSYAALILPYVTMPLGVFLMRQFMYDIPNELMEAAKIDGAGDFRTFIQIVLPLSKPPLATLFILSFLQSWNNFLWPLVAAQTQNKYTLPVALSLFSTGAHATDFGLLMAGAVVAIFPILLLFIFLQRYFIQGIATTGLK